MDGVSEKSLRGVLPDFVGEQEQVAPLFSAKSVDGVRAYELARKEWKRMKAEGPDADGAGFDHSATEALSKQWINITEIELLRFCPDGLPEDSMEMESSARNADGSVNRRNCRINVTDNSALHLPHADIRVACSKGTYIRALARDLGEALGSGAHLDGLRRTRTGGFRVEDALTVNQAVDLFNTRISENDEQDS